MKNIILLLGLFFCSNLVYSQQVSNGYAQTITGFNNILNTGIYDSESTQVNYPYEIPQWPWKYLFVMRHNRSDVNYQFQMSSTFEHDDRIFFRKLAHLTTDTEYNNNWHELATRGGNTFNGSQRVNGDLHLSGNLSLGQYLFIPTNKSLILGDNSTPNQKLEISFIGDGQRGDSYMNYSGNLFFCNSLNSTPSIAFSKDSNIGIGTLDPKSKLHVNGTIKANEIIVQSGWADFVFKKGYNLPTLENVKKHIEEKGTLPGIPSESDVKANGVSLGEVNALLLQKIEELTLYILHQDKRIANMEQTINESKMINNE